MTNTEAKKHIDSLSVRLSRELAETKADSSKAIDLTNYLNALDVAKNILERKED